MEYESIDEIVRDLAERVYGVEDPRRQAALAFLDPASAEAAAQAAANDVEALKAQLADAEAKAADAEAKAKKSSKTAKAA